MFYKIPLLIKERPIKHDYAPLKKALILAFILIVFGIYIHFSQLNQQIVTSSFTQLNLPDFFWAILTNLGRGWLVFIIIVYFDRSEGKLVAVFIRCLIISAIVSPLAKNFFSIPRPISVLDKSEIHLIGEALGSLTSMPSGHSMTAGALMIILLMMRPLLTYKNYKRYFISVICILTCSLIGYSRIAVGAHWPADVLVGFGIGMIIGCIAIYHEFRQPWANFLASNGPQITISIFQAISVFILIWSAAENYDFTMTSFNSTKFLYHEEGLAKVLLSLITTLMFFSSIRYARRKKKLIFSLEIISLPIAYFLSFLTFFISLFFHFINFIIKMIRKISLKINSK